MDYKSNDYYQLACQHFSVVQNYNDYGPTNELQKCKCLQEMHEAFYTLGMCLSSYTGIPAQDMLRISNLKDLWETISPQLAITTVDWSEIIYILYDWSIATYDTISDIGYVIDLAVTTFMSLNTELENNFSQMGFSHYYEVRNAFQNSGIDVTVQENFMQAVVQFVHEHGITVPDGCSLWNVLSSNEQLQQYNL